MTAPGRRRIGASPGFDDDGEPGTEAEDDADISLPPPPGAGGRAAAAAAAAAHEEDLEEEEEGNEEADALEEEDDEDEDEEEEDDAHLAAEVAMAMAPGASSHDGQQGRRRRTARRGPITRGRILQQASGCDARARRLALPSRPGRSTRLDEGRRTSAACMSRLLAKDRLDAWRVKYTTFPDGSQLALDLAALTAAQEPHMPPACVECEMRLPTDYPFSPPSLRIVRPRFRKQTGYVINGALCMELLTPQGWNVTFSIEAILEQVRVFARTHARDPSLACMHARHTHIFSLAYMPFPQHAGTRPSRPRQGRHRDAA